MLVATFKGLSIHIKYIYIERGSQHDEMLTITGLRWRVLG